MTEYIAVIAVKQKVKMKRRFHVVRVEQIFVDVELYRGEKPPELSKRITDTLTEEGFKWKDMSFSGTRRICGVFTKTSLDTKLSDIVNIKGKL